jgi:hypothetical protein
VEAEAAVQRAGRDVPDVDADLARPVAALSEHVSEQGGDGVAGVAAPAVLWADPDAVAEPAGVRVGLDGPHRPDQHPGVQRLDRELGVVDLGAVDLGDARPVRRPVLVAAGPRDAVRPPIEPDQPLVIGRIDPTQSHLPPRQLDGRMRAERARDHRRRPYRRGSIGWRAAHPG